MADLGVVCNFKDVNPRPTIIFHDSTSPHPPFLLPLLAENQIIWQSAYLFNNEAMKQSMHVNVSFA